MLAVTRELAELAKPPGISLRQCDVQAAALTVELRAHQHPLTRRRALILDIRGEWHDSETLLDAFDLLAYRRTSS